MSVFDDVTLTWDQKDYVVKSDQIMKLIAVMEEHATLEELTLSRGLPRARISMAFSAGLRFAGCFVEPDIIYSRMFDKATSMTITNAVTAILSIFIPPEHLRSATIKKNLAENQPKRATEKTQKRRT